MNQYAKLVASLTTFCQICCKQCVYVCMHIYIYIYIHTYIKHLPGFTSFILLPVILTRRVKTKEMIKGHVRLRKEEGLPMAMQEGEQSTETRTKEKKPNLS